MRYGIIFTMDCTRDEYVNYYLPPKRIRRKLQLTEGDEQYDYDHLEGAWTKGKHRKLVGELNQDDFDELVSFCGLRAQDVETMGSLGVPWAGCGGFGVAPAVSFTSSHYSAFVDAYVTPIPSFDPVNRAEDEEWQERAWDRIKAALLRRYN